MNGSPEIAIGTYWLRYWATRLLPAFGCCYFYVSRGSVVNTVMAKSKTRQFQISLEVSERILKIDRPNRYTFPVCYQRWTCCSWRHSVICTVYRSCRVCHCEWGTEADPCSVTIIRCDLLMSSCVILNHLPSWHSNCVDRREHITPSHYVSCLFGCWRVGLVILEFVDGYRQLTRRPSFEKTPSVNIALRRLWTLQ